MDTQELVVRSRRVVTPEGLRAASVRITHGVITAVAAFEVVPLGYAVFDAGESVVMPGLVDTHVHINEPGRTGWEGFQKATQAAAAGGVTTLIDMPLNSIPPTTSGEGFRAKLEAAQGQCWVDVGFWGGVVPGNTPELRGLFDAGVFGFKCFLVPSGVPEFPHLTETDLRAALPELASIGAVLLAHSELPGPIQKQQATAKQADPTRYLTWLASRPRAAENKAIELLVRLSKEFGTRVHVVHLSSSEALPVLRQAIREHVPISAETCPHYLCFSAGEIPPRATQFKCAPPIRERENQEQLWAALATGEITLVASDHSPCPPEMKRRGSGDFLTAWGGISSLQLSLPGVWTQARQRGYTLQHVAEWMCRGPAQLAGLEKRKGAIAPGYDADLAVWNPDATFRVEPAKLYHRHTLTPYADQVLHGVVETTFLRGQKVYHQGKFPTSPNGNVLLRGRT